jgi:hypothetical protein
MQVATLAASRVLYRAGRIPPADPEAIDARIRQALDL